jgi:MFS family permease
MKLNRVEQPNRSKRHWIVAFICCGLALSVMGIPVNAGGVFFTPVAESLGVLRGASSIHSTLTLLGAAVISLFAPALIKKYSLKSVLVVGILLTSVSNIIMGFGQNLMQFFILGSIRGIGSGLIAVVPLTMIINEWFDKHHGLITSIVLSFTGIAGAIFSPIFTYLIEAIGWEYSYILMGIFILIGGLPAIIYPFSLNPRDDGLLPYGYGEKKDKNGQEKVYMKESKGIDGTLLFLVLIFAILLTMITGIPQHFPGYAETINHTLSVGSVMLSAAMIGNILFKVLFGLLSDRLGSAKSAIFMIVLNIISIVLLLSVSNVSVLILSSFLFGTIYSLPAVGVTLMTREFFGIKNFAKVYPVISFANAIGGAISISLVGYIYDFMGSYVPAFIISLGFHVINIAFILLAQRRVTTK